MYVFFKADTIIFRFEEIGLFFSFLLYWGYLKVDVMISDEIDILNRKNE